MITKEIDNALWVALAASTKLISKGRLVPSGGSGNIEGVGV